MWLLVDENEETDILFVNDTDSVVSSPLPQGDLRVTAGQLTGLGAIDDTIRQAAVPDMDGAGMKIELGQQRTAKNANR